MHRVVVGWQEAHARVGRHLELGENLCFGFHFYLANSREQGIREAAGFYEENLKMFGPLRLVRALSDQQIEDMSDPRKAPYAGLPTLEEAIDKGGVLCGSPDQIIEHLKKLEERYPGLDRVSVSLSVGVPKTAVLEQLERFATEVMPAFKPVEKQAVLAD
jgi:alkanesulfonate monooxygenase SsuD/methylene tetrahydromethanopterin reductase-like flavin-dependent oxidoreductase (luciferase family)